MRAALGDAFVLDGSVIELDGWVCGGCRSLNARRAGHCYACRTPRRLAMDARAAALQAPTWSTLEDAPSVADQLALGRQSGATFAPTNRLAWLVRGGVILVTIVTLAKLAVDIRTLAAFEGQVIDEGRLGVGLAPGPATLAMVVAWLLAFIAWGAWLRRIVANVPALGGGFPVAGPAAAFVSGTVPGANLAWGTAVLRDAILRLSPRGEARLGLLTAWWIAVVAASLPWLAQLPGEPEAVRAALGQVTGWLGGLLATGSGGQLVANQAAQAASGVLLVIAAGLAIWLVDHVEDLQEVRWIQLRAGLETRSGGRRRGPLGGRPCTFGVAPGAAFR